MAFPPLGNSDRVVVSVSIDFLLNSKRDASLNQLAYDYSRANWDGLRDHLRDVPWEDIFKLNASSAVGFRLKLMYISIIISTTLSLTHPHGFQQLVLLPLFIEIISFVCTNKINLLSLE